MLEVALSLTLKMIVRLQLMNRLSVDAARMKMYKQVPLIDLLEIKPVERNPTSLLL